MYMTGALLLRPVHQVWAGSMIMTFWIGAELSDQAGLQTAWQIGNAVQPQVCKRVMLFHQLVQALQAVSPHPLTMRGGACLSAGAQTRQESTWVHLRLHLAPRQL